MRRRLSVERQAAAAARGVAVETLTLALREKGKGKENGGLGDVGVVVRGGRWEGGALVKGEGAVATGAALCWVEEEADGATLEVPLYASTARGERLATVRVRAEEMSEAEALERAVALAAEE